FIEFYIMNLYIISIFFFFQAEDGIRDFHVTGVQTCALPILAQSVSRRLSSDRSGGAQLTTTTRRFLVANWDAFSPGTRLARYSTMTTTTDSARPIATPSTFGQRMRCCG